MDHYFQKKTHSSFNYKFARTLPNRFQTFLLKEAFSNVTEKCIAYYIAVYVII